MRPPLTLPRGRWADSLRTDAGKDAILAGIEENDTVIVLADTGSGKTTRASSLPPRRPERADFSSPRASSPAAEIPQFLVRSNIPCEAPRIVCTQPRRVAATSLAQRVSTEMGQHLGGLVGYTVRFDDRTSRGTRLKYATDGALLAEMLGDRDLDAYDVVVLDEAHERSLRTDMLMGFLKDIQLRRKDKYRAWKAKAKGKARADVNGDGDAPTLANGKHAEERDPTELKIVVMSATIDAKRFSEFFFKCVRLSQPRSRPRRARRLTRFRTCSAPVLYVQGQQHKVTLLYSAEPQLDYLDSALKTIFQIHKAYPPGSILVFLPGAPARSTLSRRLTTWLIQSPSICRSGRDRVARHVNPGLPS